MLYYTVPSIIIRLSVSIFQLKAEFIGLIEDNETITLIHKDLYKDGKAYWMSLSPKIRTIARQESKTSISMSTLLEE